jgi:ABC-2 type transport system permease protein
MFYLWAAGMLTGALLVDNFLIIGLARLNQDLQSLVEYTPLYYFQGGEAIGAMNWEWVLGIGLAALVLTLLAWLLFLRRDIRVGGEGSWRLPWARRKAASR